jgi:N-acetylglucosamine-6-phosphate deacetylase
MHPIRSRRPEGSKKNARNTIQTHGLVDIHFHGAFGIDLMTAQAPQLKSLSAQLGEHGIAAFCPTTVSAPPRDLLATVRRLGTWIRNTHSSPSIKTSSSALPIGIHLEGPFINTTACGAHPPSAVRHLSFDELDLLWEASQHTLQIITVAPETLTPQESQRLIRWSDKKGIVLSIGHSLASSDEARHAFDSGFQGITHAWNAMPFQTRNPGVLGAALGRKNLYVELIIDQAHVSREVIRWTRKLHTPNPICFISDCVSAGGGLHAKKPHPNRYRGSLGNQQIQLKDGACRLKNGQLAGGGLLLSESYTRWLESESRELDLPVSKILRETIAHVTSYPIHYLKISPNWLKSRQVAWKITSNQKIRVIPIDSAASSG